MAAGFSLLPPAASSIARQVDYLSYFLITVGLFFVVLIFGLITLFAVRYRRRGEGERPAPIHGSLPLEILWTAIPLAIVLFVFFWGAKIYFTVYRPPADALEVHIVGKQWMWKIQHPTGQREINELHVPRDRPVKLIITSEDVIHSFFVPAFRIKRDAVPGRYTTTWFTATQNGEYRFFCSQYCGTKHSQMIGRVLVTDPADYEAWLAGGVPGEPPAAAGEKLFVALGCATCHQARGTGRGPSLVGLYGSAVLLQDGRKVLADDDYLRQSILDPQAKIVAAFQPIMPVFKGQVSEDSVIQLLAYIKSLAPAAPKEQTRP